MNRAVLFVGISLLGALQNGLAQQPAFRASAQLVQINVIASDKKGNVANLTKDVFLITDAGKPRSIAVFSETSAFASGAVANSLPADTFSNRTAATPNVTVILLDRLNTFAGGSEVYEERPRWMEDLAVANARQHLIRFVSTLRPDDCIAIYSLGNSLSVLSDFTSDRAQLKSVLEKYQPGSLSSREAAEPLPVHTPVPGDFNAAVDRERRNLAGIVNRNRAETTMAALAAIAAHVAGIPGRKSLVWLTSDPPVRGAVAAQVASRANMAIYPVDARGLLPETPISDNGDAAAPGVFGRFAGATAQSSQPLGINAMLDLAADTGGRAFTNTNDLEGAIRRALDDGALTYTLGFYVDAASLDGKAHELKVSVKRPGIRLRYPKFYSAVPDTETAEAKRVEFQRALESPLEAGTIPLVAHITRSKGEIAVTGVIDIRSFQLAQVKSIRRGAVEIYIYQQNSVGLILRKSRSKLDLQLTSENYKAYLKSGVFFRQIVSAENGAAVIRILAGDPNTGAIGSLIVPMSQIK